MSERTDAILTAIDAGLEAAAALTPDLTREFNLDRAGTCDPAWTVDDLEARIERAEAKAGALSESLRRLAARLSADRVLRIADARHAVQTCPDIAGRDITTTEEPQA